ncbi:ARF1-like protein, partial [Mya arenaria]
KQLSELMTPNTLPKVTDKMGNLCTRYYEYKDVKLLLLGLDMAGKTTLLNHLKLGEVVTTIPTFGFNLETVNHKNITFIIYDIGGGDKMRQQFRHHYPDTDAVVMVIDGADPERLQKLNCNVIKPALHADELAHSIFLFLVNKRDLPNCLSAEEVAANL